MRKIKARTLAVPVFILAVTATFQNCDGGFKYNPTTKELSSTSSASSSSGVGLSGPGPVVTGPFALSVYGAGSALLADTATVDSGFDFEVRASGTGVDSALLTWSIPASNNTAGCALTSSGVTYSRTLRCSTAGLVQVRVDGTFKDGSSASAFTNRTVVLGGVGSPTPPVNVNIVEFRIRAGTGKGAWDTSATAPVAFVGQTLRVYNDDNVVHRMHTPGTPCPHEGMDTAPNASADCVLSSAHSPTAVDLYDHNNGTSATFYLNVIDGAAQYARTFSIGGVQKSCVNCHNALATSAVKGAGFNSIKAAITSNIGGMGAITMTDDEIRAVGYVLSK